MEPDYSCMDAGSLCRHHALRSDLYPTDCGTKRGESSGGFPDSELGIQYSSSSRVDGLRVRVFFQGNAGLHPYTWHHHANADPDGTSQVDLSEYGGKLENPVQKETGAAEGSRCYRV